MSWRACWRPWRMRTRNFRGSSPNALAADKLTTSEAKQHVGETATVCGVVASARYSERARGKPTFLDIDKAYPQQIFTVVIWGDNRAKFGAPELIT
jgi:hypothetical protein